MSNNKKRNIIIGSLCAVVLLMAVGYAAFQTVLNIQGTSNITSSWNVKITNVTSKNIVGTASNNGDPSFEALAKVANGNATKIIVPSELQNMATLGTTLSEMFKDKK